jgi:hypothetical protein
LKFIGLFFWRIVKKAHINKNRIITHGADTAVDICAVSKYEIIGCKVKNVLLREEAIKKPVDKHD